MTSTTGDLLDALIAALEDDRDVVLATVVAVQGSSPLPVGSTLVVVDDQTVLGSVSGGCVESAVHDEARRVGATATPVLLTYGPPTHPYEIGLTCGGTVSIFVEPVRAASLPGWRTVAERVRTGRAARRSVIIAGPDPGHELFGADPQEPATTESALVTTAGTTTFVQVWPAAPRMIIVGADGLAGALSAQAQLLGYRVTVCDPRPVFATPARFPGAEVVLAWPDRYLRDEAQAGRCETRTAVCVLTHDGRVDVPVIMVALALDALAFVGATGSRATCADRDRRLREAGCAPADLARLRTPLGLDLGGRQPAEAAVSIVAEILAERHSRDGGRLRDSRGALHRRRDDDHREPEPGAGTATGHGSAASPRPTG